MNGCIEDSYQVWTLAHDYWCDDTGLAAQHAASVVSLAASSNYYGHPSNEQNLSGVNHGGGAHSPGKYQENGHDTFSDFVTLVCQEAQNTQNAQVISSWLKLTCWNSPGRCERDGCLMLL